jgi:hypothetical protein
MAEGVLDQLDLTAIAERVINELELSELIRESTGTVTVDAVDALRSGGMQADRLVSRVIGRILMRRELAGTDGPPPPDAPKPADTTVP